MVPAPRTEAQLVALCRTGDESAWFELVERFSNYVYAIIVRAYRVPAADADDIFQEVFARAYERLGSLRDDSAFQPWLAQLTRRLTIDRLRLSSRELPGADPIEALASEAGPDLELIDEALMVRKALDRLPQQCREVLDRFFARDESYRTISQALKIPPGTIASRISRCLQRLREQLEEENPRPNPSRNR
jgi:RNA polymerase sigma-70 factor (ECF subfamily)